MRYQFLKYTLAGLLLLTVFVACKKEYATIEEEDATAITDYLQKNNLNSLMTQYGNTGIYYQIITPGTAVDTLKYSDLIYMTYTINSFDGKAKYIDENLYRYSSFLGYLQLWTQNLPEAAHLPVAFRIAIKDILKKKGGSLRILIPSRLAYGQQGTEDKFVIAGNQSLDCTINLYDVNNSLDFEDVFVKKYIQTNNLTGLTKTSTGLYYQIITPGTGIAPITLSSTITAISKGKLTNGTVFDQNDSSKPIVGVLGSSFIPGWQEGLPLIKKGGKIRLIIPPSLGYGTKGNGAKIPPNSILDFDVEVTEVSN